MAAAPAVMAATTVAEAGIECTHAGMHRVDRAGVETAEIETAQIEAAEVEPAGMAGVMRTGIGEDSAIGAAVRAHGVGKRLETAW